MTVAELIDLLAAVPANAQVFLDTGKPVLEEQIMVQPIRDEDEVVGYCLMEDSEPEQLNLPFNEEK